MVEGLGAEERAEILGGGGETEAGEHLASGDLPFPIAGVGGAALALVAVVDPEIERIHDVAACRRRGAAIVVVGGVAVSVGVGEEGLIAGKHTIDGDGEIAVVKVVAANKGSVFRAIGAEAGVANLADGVGILAIEEVGVGLPAVAYRVTGDRRESSHLYASHDAARLDSISDAAIAVAVGDGAALEPSNDAAGILCRKGAVGASDFVVALVAAVVDLTGLIDGDDAADTCVAAHEGDGVAAVAYNAVVGVADTTEGTEGGIVEGTCGSAVADETTVGENNNTHVAAGGDGVGAGGDDALPHDARVGIVETDARDILSVLGGVRHGEAALYDVKVVVADARHVGVVAAEVAAVGATLNGAEIVNAESCEPHET